MSLTRELPPRLTCLLCFSINSMERRYDVKGRVFYSCPLCNYRIFLHSDTHAYGILFWSKTLTDELAQAARADLERAIAARQQVVIRRPVLLDTTPATVSVEAQSAQR